MLITFICSNQDLRIPSFILRCKNMFSEIIVIDDFMNNDEIYSQELGINCYKNKKSEWKDVLKNHEIKDGFILINLDENFCFEKLDSILSRDFSKMKNIEINYLNEYDKIAKSNNINDVISSVNNFDYVSWIYFTKHGFDSFQNDQKIGNLQIFNLNSCEFSKSEKEKLRRSVFEFNIKKNPLIYFGIPGLVLMISSLFLVINVVSRYQSIDSVSMGTAIITISTTVLGILSIMSAIISFIFGKQTEFILTNYSD